MLRCCNVTPSVCCTRCDQHLPHPLVIPLVTLQHRNISTLVLLPSAMPLMPSVHYLGSWVFIQPTANNQSHSTQYWIISKQFAKAEGCSDGGNHIKHFLMAVRRSRGPVKRSRGCPPASRGDQMGPM